MENKDLLLARFRELAKRCDLRDIPQHTDFLNVSEQALFYELCGEVRAVPHCFYGGHGEAERNVLLFLPSYMREEAGGAQTALPELFADIVACIKIRPRGEKFSDALTHRDYLGALMNLGIERDQLGDILTDGTTAYLFCMADIAEFICGELLRVRHTPVSCERITLSDCRVLPKFEELSVNVASERLDAVISAVYKLSRGVSAELIAAERVYADGKTVRQPGSGLRNGARVSVRGYGKFIYEGAERETKKGRLYVKIRKFV